MNAVLISTYELGRQPFGLASPAAWLRERGVAVACADVSRDPLPEDAVRAARLVAFYVPMHTATRLAVALLPAIRQINSRAHVCFYGLYAPANESYLRRLGVQTILGGEFEEPLANLATALAANGASAAATSEPWSGRALSPAIEGFLGGRSLPVGRHGFSSDIKAPSSQRALAPEAESSISLARQHFRVPDRAGLPPLEGYARLILPGGESRVVGYTEASRGCKHLCRHCPIVPVYNGVFRIVDRDVVLEDIRRQVASGARHITFGDPDFFNGPGHALPLVEAVHREFPHLTYDVTIKIEHLLRHRNALPKLRDTGCLFVTSAVESLDDAVLERLAKHHTRADFLRVVDLFNEVGLTLAPTFVAFTPWTTLATFSELLEVIRERDLIQNVAPIQFAIRLLIPAGSRLLDLPEVRGLVGPFDDAALVHPWRHEDPRVDALCERLQEVVHTGEKMNRPRARIFERIEETANQALGRAEQPARRAMPILASRATIPYLNEPWYC